MLARAWSMAAAPADTPELRHVPVPPPVPGPQPPHGIAGVRMGSGMAVGQLDDVAGDCGRVLQTLLIAER
jgi:hypothetical protein